MPQTKATITVTNTDTKDVFTVEIDSDKSEHILVGLTNGQYVVKIKTNNLGPHVSDESTIEFRYNRFNDYGLVRTIIINPSSKFKYIAVASKAEIPEGTSVEGKLYCEQLPSGDFDYRKYINFKITDAYLNDIITLKNFTPKVKVDLVLRGSNNKFVSPVLHDIYVYAK